MTTFGRTERQNEIWGELNAIRAIVDKGLLSPEDGEYAGADPDPADLQDDWNDLVEDYQDIHADNDTFG